MRRHCKKTANRFHGLLLALVVCCLWQIITNVKYSSTSMPVRVAPKSTTRQSITTTTITTNRVNILQREKVPIQVDKNDYNYRSRENNASPIVIEKYKLIFFTIQKTGCTVWKQLFRRMMGHEDWRTGPTWPTDKTGLTYLFHYNISQATQLMNDPTYTRAVFVRDPKERYLSAFLDKSVHSDYFKRFCCKNRIKAKVSTAVCLEKSQSFQGFVNLTRKSWCLDSHWGPQTSFVGDKYALTLDFVGHLESAKVDAKYLLRRIGAWEEYGKSGWGKDGNEYIFQSTSNVKHRTGTGTNDSHSRLKTYYTPEMEAEIEQRFASDYSRPEYNLPLTKIMFV